MVDAANAVSFPEDLFISDMVLQFHLLQLDSSIITISEFNKKY